MFLNKIRNIFVSRTQNLGPQQMLRARANGETFVSATMCPRLPGPEKSEACLSRAGCLSDEMKQMNFYFPVINLLGLFISVFNSWLL